MYKMESSRIPLKEVRQRKAVNVVEGGGKTGTDGEIAAELGLAFKEDEEEIS